MINSAKFTQEYYLPQPLTQNETDRLDIDYFRKYALNALQRCSDFVTVKCEKESETSYSILIKKSEYRKYLKNDLSALAVATSKYTDYLPTKMSVSELIKTDSHGGNIEFSEYNLIENEWSKSSNETFYVRTEDSIRREDEANSQKKKEDRENKLEAKKSSKTTITRYYLEQDLQD
jgi:hypothetical protein